MPVKDATDPAQTLRKLLYSLLHGRRTLGICIGEGYCFSLHPKLILLLGGASFFLRRGVTWGSGFRLFCLRLGSRFLSALVLALFLSFLLARFAFIFVVAATSSLPFCYGFLFPSLFLRVAHLGPAFCHLLVHCLSQLEPPKRSVFLLRCRLELRPLLLKVVKVR